MKKLVIAILALTMALSIFGCAKKNPIEVLSDVEYNIYNALRAGFDDGFYNPQEASLMRIGDYDGYGYKYYDEFRDYDADWSKGMAMNDEATYVTVRIAGTNRLGGGLNEYFILILRDIAPKSRFLYGTEAYESGAEYGDLLQCDETSIVLPCDDVDVGNINRALKYYWEEKLGLS